MRKYQVGDLKKLIAIGGAEDVSSLSKNEILKLKETTSKLGFSFGVYGKNGVLLKDNQTNKLYAILGSISNLF